MHAPKITQQMCQRSAPTGSGALGGLARHRRRKIDVICRQSARLRFLRRPPRAACRLLPKPARLHVDNPDGTLAPSAARAAQALSQGMNGHRLLAPSPGPSLPDDRRHRRKGGWRIQVRGSRRWRCLPSLLTRLMRLQQSPHPNPYIGSNRRAGHRLWKAPGPSAIYPGEAFLTRFPACPRCRERPPALVGQVLDHRPHPLCASSATAFSTPTAAPAQDRATTQPFALAPPPQRKHTAPGPPRVVHQRTA